MAGHDPMYFSQTKAKAQAESGAWRDHGDAGGGPVPGTAGRAEAQPTQG